MIEEAARIPRTGRPGVNYVDGGGGGWEPGRVARLNEQKRHSALMGGLPSDATGIDPAGKERRPDARPHRERGKQAPPDHFPAGLKGTGRPSGATMARLIVLSHRVRCFLVRDDSFVRRARAARLFLPRSASSDSITCAISKSARAPAARRNGRVHQLATPAKSMHAARCAKTRVPRSRIPAAPLRLAARAPCADPSVRRNHAAIFPASHANVAHRPDQPGGGVA